MATLKQKLADIFLHLKSEGWKKNNASCQLFFSGLHYRQRVRRQEREYQSGQKKGNRTSFLLY